MTQVASYQVPAHPSGLEMRTQLNAIVLALLGDNSGPVEPAEIYPGMMWGDTTANRLKRRNNINDAWIDIGPLDDFLGEMRTAGADKVSKTGDTMSGTLVMGNSNSVLLHTPSGGAYVRADVAIPNGYGGTGVGMGIINSANNTWNFQMSDNGCYTFSGYNWGEFQSMGNGDPNGYLGRYGPGYIKLTRWDWGPYIDFLRAGTDDFRWRIYYDNTNDRLAFARKDNSYVSFDPTGAIFYGPCQLATDGNIYGTVWGGWLSNYLSGIATNANNAVARTGAGYMALGWQVNGTECIDASVDYAWWRHVIVSYDGRWYSPCSYDSAGFIAVNIDGWYGGGGNRGIVTEPSDGRVKVIHGESKVDALGAILQIPIIRYSFREGEPEYIKDDVRECGFDAQVVQSVAPSMVFEVGEKKICNVYPNAGLAYVFKAIQQLFGILTDIRNELAALRAGKT